MQRGIFELQTAAHLLQKLRYDLARLEQNPLDQYAAFDFFVAAEHLVDWIHPNDRQAQRAERDGNVLLQVCSHLASGSKHFVTTAKHHQSVDHTGLKEGAFSQEFSDAFDKSRLEVHLTGEAAMELGDVIWVVPLARAVLAWWEEHSALQSSRPAV
jgi:hypothetical protein